MECGEWERLYDITTWKDLLEIDWEFLDIIVIKIEIHDNGNCEGIPRKFQQDEMIKYFVVYNTADF